MSTKTDTSSKRRYRKRRRAEQEELTRLRITEAAVDLHGSLGPAHTTVSAVAERAGVQRATVYRHFPDDVALFQACSSHWLAQNPLPDLLSWGEIDDPAQRLRSALEEVYSWFDRCEPMLEKTTRDAPLVPAMQRPMEASAAWFAAAVDVLAKGRGGRGGRRDRTRAAIGHALAFTTWSSLVRDQGLSQAGAIDLMADFVAAAEAVR